MTNDKKDQFIPSDKEQLDRFKQTARELGCDETGEAFEAVFRKTVPAKKPKLSERDGSQK